MTLDPLLLSRIHFAFTATSARGVPFAMAVLAVVFAFSHARCQLWPYMIPYTVTVWDAAAPPQSLKFQFWGLGLVVFPVVVIYTGAVFWIFRGKTLTRLPLDRDPEGLAPSPAMCERGTKPAGRVR